MGLNLSNQQIAQELDLDFEFVHNVRKPGYCFAHSLGGDPAYLTPWNPYWAKI
jgi:hypothetical protein